MTILNLAFVFWVLVLERREEDMHLPRFVVAALAVRQSVTVLPSSYCSPGCRKFDLLLSDTVNIKIALEWGGSTKLTFMQRHAESKH